MATNVSARSAHRFGRKHRAKRLYEEAIDKGDAISLTYHRRSSDLHCHYCDFREPMPHRCPTCQSEDWAFLGAGTEKLGDKLQGELGGLRVLRLDRDTASGKNLRRILSTFREHRADVLVSMAGGAPVAAAALWIRT